nr:MAG TPA: Nucleoside 2-deoxyribosyltransferase like protein [Caudoviricetes sp.]
MKIYISGKISGTDLTETRARIEHYIATEIANAYNV